MRFDPVRGRKAILMAALAVPLAAGAQSEPRVLMFDEGRPVWSPRPMPAPRATPKGDDGRADRLRQLVELQIAAASEVEPGRGVVPALPAGTRVDFVQVQDAAATVALTLPPAFLEEFDEARHDELLRLEHHWLHLVGGFDTGALLGRVSDEESHRPLGSFLPPPPPLLEKDEEVAEPEKKTVRAGQAAAALNPQPVGALTGASIFLSPGHGWHYSSGAWRTQRGVSLGIIEDHSNWEAACQYLAQYLWNAGARVYIVRERDSNTNMRIVETGGSGHTQTGTWTSEDRVGAYNGNLRYAQTVTGAPTATSTFTPNLPAAGFYSVWAWYRTSSGGQTATDARITINHTGGSTVWSQDQTRDGQTWKYLGTYYFEAGSNPATGSVVITNQSSVAGQRVIADAIRFGGGMGDVRDNVSNTISGKPRFEESGRYYAAFMGKSDWASYNQVSGMPRYAAWEHEAWESGTSVYVAWHTNAGGGTGTETYSYGTGEVAGSSALATAIQNELISDIRSAWDPNWVNRGKKSSNLGEVNPSNNPEMPSALTEVAFHDHPSDAQAIKDPRFRLIAARAVYQALVKFYVANRTGFTNSTLLPEPPTHVRVKSNGGGGVTVSWAAPPFQSNGHLGHAATGYRVYRSRNGKGFDNGVTVPGGSTLTWTDNSVTPGEVYYYRVTATNAGGESFPSETLAVRVPHFGSPPVLIVNGFDRLDATANLVQSGAERGPLGRMNTYDYVIAHATALHAAGRAFDSCGNEAIEAGQVSLDDYQSVVWILGRESGSDNAFSATEQAKVTSFLALPNKGLFVSGSEVGRDLDFSNKGRTFYNSVLRAGHVSNPASAYAARGAAGSIFEGLTLSYDNGASVYNVVTPDVITPVNGSQAALYYGASSGSNCAAVQSKNPVTGSGVVYLAIPFETITSVAVRNQMMAAALTYLEPVNTAASDWQLFE